MPDLERTFRERMREIEEAIKERDKELTQAMRGNSLKHETILSAMEKAFDRIPKDQPGIREIVVASKECECGATKVRRKYVTVDVVTQRRIIALQCAECGRTRIGRVK